MNMQSSSPMQGSPHNLNSSLNKVEDLGLHRTHMKSSTVDRLSKVLLVIFSNNELKSNQDLFDMFSPYVRVSRVLIFERKDANIKCFVEMMSLQEATYVKNQFSFQKAKNPTNKTNVQIYYAQIQTIDLQNHYSEGQDFTSFYAKNPQYPCQYLNECENPSMLQFPQQYQNNPPTQSYFQPNHNLSYSPQPHSQPDGNNGNFSKPVFGKPPYINQAMSEVDYTFDQNNNTFMDQGGIRPSSISSIDFTQQQQNHYTTHAVPLSHFGKGTTRHTLHANPMSNTPINTFESKVYAHIPTSQAYHSGEKSRNARADQFHKDLLKKDGILQNHISQQFHSNFMNQSQMKQHPNQQSSMMLSPAQVPPFKGNGVSQPSSSIRSPSSTQYSLNNPNGCDLSDVDENVSASHPSAFQIRYRDDRFFNGGNMYTSDDIPPGISVSDASIFAQAGEEAKRVLFVRHLDQQDLKISMIYNLFSNYGNIVKIIFMKQKRQALIEYETTPQALSAKDNLNNILYYGAQIKIDFSKYDQIDLQRKKLHSGESNDQEQVLSIPAQFYRYKQAMMIPQYSPKPTLHVSNIRKEYFEFNVLFEFFSQLGAKIKMLKLIPNEKKQMCLIQYETLDDALRIISTYHDFPFHGRNLCISFTKNPGNQYDQQLSQQPQVGKIKNNSVLDPQNQFSQQQQQHQQRQLQTGQQQQQPNQMNPFYNQNLTAYKDLNEQNLRIYYDLNDYDDELNEDDELQRDIQNQIHKLGI